MARIFAIRLLPYAFMYGSAGKRINFSAICEMSFRRRWIRLLLREEARYFRHTALPGRHARYHGR